MWAPWRASGGRVQLQPSLHRDSGGKETIILNLKQANLPSGQTLVIEARLGVAVPEVLDAAGRSIPVRTRIAKDRVFLMLP
jgi:hypothetical protein